MFIDYNIVIGYDGSQLDMTIEHLISCCVNPEASEGIQPCSFAMVSGGRYLGISLGSREIFPKNYDYRDMAAIRGLYAKVWLKN